MIDYFAVNNMKLIVGLGNPGSQYEDTRHNMGFMVIDELAETLKISNFKNDFDASIARFNYMDEVILLAKPLTYMNLSGTSVKKIIDYYKIKIEDLLVVSDDMALEPGRIRLREKGSSGGQKGLQNIIDNLNTSNFKRIRVGIGEPEHNVVDYVLSKPKKEDQEKIDEAISNAVEAILFYLKNDFLKASSIFNSKK